MSLIVDCLNERSKEENSEAFLKLLEEYKEKLLLLPQDVQDNDKYNSNYSGMESFHGFGCNYGDIGNIFFRNSVLTKDHVLTDEAINYSNVIYRMNGVLGKLWREYLYIPSDYASFPFFKTQYYKNLKMSEDYFVHSVLSSEYPQVNLGDMKLLADTTNRVLVPLEFVDIDLINFDVSSEKAEAICENFQKFNNLLKHTFSGEKVYVMCHYKYINQFQVIEKNGYDEIYWPQSLHDQKDMFEFSIVNNRNMYNMMMNMQKYYDDFFKLMSSASIDIIEKIKENIIMLNDKIDDNQFAQWKSRLQDIWKYHTPYYYIPDYSEARQMGPAAMSAMITNGCASPSDPDFGLIGVKYIIKPKPLPYEAVDCAYDSNEQRKKGFADAVKSYIDTNSLTDKPILTSLNRTNYHKDIFDTPIVFSTRNLFDVDNALVRIGLCFGKDINEDKLESKGLVVNCNNAYQKVKILTNN